MKKIVWMLVCAFILLVGCSDKEKQEAENNEKKDVDVQEKSNEPEVSNEIIAPLTGMAIDEPTDNRIVAVMVNNHSKARPQTGLSKADIVFEMLAEGKITRFLAMFQSELPDVVGPVRSAREYYFNLANDYNALYVYHGAANFVNDMIINRGIEHLNGSLYDNDGNLFKRESFRKSPHNSYLQLGAVKDVAASKGYETTAEIEPLPFIADDEAEISGDPAQHVEIVYAQQPMEIVEYDYNASEEVFTRYNDREPTVELNTEEPIQAANVLIVETPHEVIDDAGRRAIDMESGGNAYLLQKGKVQELQWENREGRILPVKDGEVVGFMPGKTWINVIPTNPGLTGSVNITN
ncbi:DUF3048 domain-containing protein [Oceanobacillus manasiensis]|uniref:DUF3048 domain-containing protein n=1 Tax=Oceanobacillus manasiensis TaxID=586413 RepID=UPI0005AB0DA8|nr:DUF3048 domain-containing protein [Oceanobacillus manasiensis]